MSRGDISMSNAKIFRRNFSGKANPNNFVGVRNFCVYIDDEVAADLTKDGWNVKWFEPDPDGRFSDIERQAFLNVTVRFEPIPPKIWLINDSIKIRIDERNAQMVDFAEIAKVDLIITPYAWEMNGKRGIKAYLKAAYITAVEDEFEKKYREIPEFNFESSNDEIFEP